MMARAATRATVSSEAGACTASSILAHGESIPPYTGYGYTPASGISLRERAFSRPIMHYNDVARRKMR